jgi:hypothetical protein
MPEGLTDHDPSPKRLPLCIQVWANYTPELDWALAFKPTFFMYA